MGKVLPEYLSEWTTERVREEGVHIIPNTQVQNVELINDQLKLKLMNGETVLCDNVIVAVGSEPNTELAKKSGLEIDKTYGGYLVNAELEARRHLYVVKSMTYSKHLTNYLIMAIFSRLVMLHAFTIQNWVEDV